MQKVALLLIFTTALTMAGFGSSTSIDSAAAASDLQKTDEQWSAAAARNDLDATLAFYGDGAVVLPGNAAIATDAKAIREIWAGMLGPNSVVSWKVTKAEVAKSGELGYVYGTYELTIKDPKGGPAVHDVGKLVEIWKKQPDGKWKCIVDTYNSDLPVPEPAAPKN